MSGNRDLFIQMTNESHTLHAIPFLKRGISRVQMAGAASHQSSKARHFSLFLRVPRAPAHQLALECHRQLCLSTGQVVIHYYEIRFFFLSSFCSSLKLSTLFLQLQDRSVLIAAESGPPPERKGSILILQISDCYGFFLGTVRYRSKAS